jgi:hypothetical protein
LVSFFRSVGSILWDSPQSRVKQDRRSGKMTVV